MKEVKLTRGKVAQVDSEDYARLRRFKWHALQQGHTWYARRYAGTVDGFAVYEGLANAVMQKPGKFDHADGDGLNNQKINLRLATNSQNGANTRKAAGCSSQYKGVSWCCGWVVRCAGQYLGRFEDEKIAAQAYDHYAAQVFGKFAKLNFPISST